MPQGLETCAQHPGERLDVGEPCCQWCHHDRRVKAAIRAALSVERLERELREVIQALGDGASPPRISEAADEALLQLQRIQKLARTWEASVKNTDRAYASDPVRR